MGGQALQLSAGQPRSLTYTHGIRKDLKLLEADEELLQELLRDGLCLKGGPDEEAVLCSGSKTYAVKNVETTNLVLLVQHPTEEAAAAAGEAAGAPLASQDVNVAQAPTPPGQLLGLASQLAKNAAAAVCAPLTATAVVSSHLELVPVAPRLHQLDALLWGAQYGAEGQEEGLYHAGSEGTDRMQTDGAGIYGGDSYDDNGPSSSGGFVSGHTEEELLARVQCSLAELRIALRDRKALCLGGRYCSVDAGYQGMLLELVLLTAVEHGWPLSQLPGEQMAAALEPHGYDPRLTVHCLSSFGSPAGTCGGGSTAAAEAGTSQAAGGSGAMDTEESQSQGGREETSAGGGSGGGSKGGSGGEGSGGGFYALNEAAVCLHFAQSLFAAQPDWELGAFEAAWQRAVPEGMLPTLDMLRGEALLHGGGTGPHGVPTPRRIKHLPLAALPADAPTRFAALFKERERWQWEELEPYVQNLRAPGQTAEALLLKYTRISQQRPTDPVTYSMR